MRFHTSTTRYHPELDAYSRHLEKKHGKFKANAILASKLGRAVYFMLSNGTGFDVGKLTGLPPRRTSSS